MKRLMCLVGALILAGQSYAQAAAEASKGMESGLMDKASQFVQAKMPWMHTALTDFKHYVSQKPVEGLVREARSPEEVSVSVSHMWATRGFDGTSHLGDPSAAALGKDSFAFRDAFVASNLVAQDVAKVARKMSDAQPLPHNNTHYLALLADHELSFESAHSRQELTLSYKRCFLEKRLQCSVEVPLVRHACTLDISAEAEIGKATRAALVDATSLNSPLVRSALGDMRQVPGAPGFYDSYSNMNNFLQHVLNDAGVAFQKKQESLGLGDITVAGTYDYTLAHVDHVQLGGSLTLATAKPPRNVAFLEQALGSGATQAKMHIECSWHRGSFINPFVKCGVGYSLPTEAAVRLPYTLSYNGMSHIGERLAEVYPRSIPFSEVVTLGGAAFTDYPETTVRGFASSLHTATVKKGLSALFHVGNTFERCFGKPLFAYVGYKFQAQQGTSLDGLERPECFALDVVTHNTATRSHDLEAKIGYRLSPLCALEAGAVYRFAGRNALRERRVYGALSLSF